jgi:hypothetical protein
MLQRLLLGKKSDKKASADICSSDWEVETPVDSARYIANRRRFPCVVCDPCVTRTSGVPKGRWGGTPPPPTQRNFRTFAKAEPNSQFRGISVCNNLIRTRASFIYKLSETPK